jgi:hypothetical protein
MLPLLIQKIAQLFSTDKSPEGQEKLDAYLEKNWTGVRFGFVFKTVAVILLLVFIMSIVSRLIDYLK